MSDKNIYQGFLRATVKGAICSARAAAGLAHPGIKGTVLEILTRQLFKPLLPADIAVGTGQIIDSAGSLSPQIDVLLYDRSILPPILFDESLGIFPVEAALYAIEVKTTLTRQEIQTAHENAKVLHQLRYLQASGRNSSGAQPQVEHVRSVIFALNTDLSEDGKPEIHRYKEIYGEDPPYIAAICVVGREYWWNQGAAWCSFKCQDEFDEVLGFLGGVTNTYRKISQSRGHVPLGQYIVPESITSVTLSPSRGPMKVTIGPGGLKIEPNST
jgi:uncharacterized protein DUF6602